MKQAEIPRYMQRDDVYIRRGMGSYAVMNEAAITQALAEVRDQIKQAQQMMTQGGQDKNGQGDKATEQALANVEQLRRQLEQMQAQRGQRGQPGQQGQRSE